MNKQYDIYRLYVYGRYYGIYLQECHVAWLYNCSVQEVRKAVSLFSRPGCKARSMHLAPRTKEILPFLKSFDMTYDELADIFAVSKKTVWKYCQ